MTGSGILREKNRKTHFDLYGEHLPEYLSQLLNGFNAPGDSLSPLTSKPNWYEHDKFCLGQKVAIKYFFNLQLSALVCVFAANVYPSGIGPIIFTGKSCTVFKAFRRFIPHVVDMKSWYLDDIWDPKSHGFKIIDKVRKAHENIKKRMQSTDPQELKKKKNFERSLGSSTYISQADMAGLQFGFVGLFALHPSFFGAHYITDEELEGLLHLWRCIGYRLGIEEEYNFCKGSLAEIRQRGSDLLEMTFKPMLRFVTRDWEHIMRCTIEGVNYFGFVSFEVILLLVCEIMDLDTPKFKASVTFVQKLEYYLIRLCFSIIMRLPGDTTTSCALAEDPDFPGKSYKTENFISDIKKTHFDIHGKHLPEYLSQLLVGLNAPGDSLSPLTSKPNWYEHDKFCLGQKVAIKYFFNLQFSIILSIFPVYVFPTGLATLIFTGKSSTIFTAFKRYIPHIVNIKTWYVSDIWDPISEGFKTIEIARKVHENVRKRMNCTDPEKVTEKITLNGHSASVCPVVWSPLYEKLQEDFAVVRKDQVNIEKIYLESQKNRNFISQTDMVGVQFAFIGLFALYPSFFGAHYITDEEVEGLLHLWRCIGYRLGIEEEYNFCKGSLAEIRQRGSELMELLFKPMMGFVTRDWEHMVRCAMEGVNYFGFISFEVTLLLVCDFLNLDAPRFKASVTFQQKLVYYLLRFNFSVIMRIPGGVKLLNWLLDLALKRAISPAGVEAMRNKQYDLEQRLGRNIYYFLCKPSFLVVYRRSLFVTHPQNFNLFLLHILKMDLLFVIQNVKFRKEKKK
ncbi:hypothetical protein C0J52_11264 [Blattella germanica]|nr:hypothetical protein C0J52_11264 [Blattella germanica]